MQRSTLGITAHFRRQDGKPELPEVKSGWSGYYYHSVGIPDDGRLEDILYGEGDLEYGFIWRSTPQGHVHWAYIHYGGCTLTEEDRDYIRYLLVEHTQ